MLFDNNSMMNINNSNLFLYSSKEGFLRGNMFKNLYTPYKNLTYLNISPKSELEASLFNVMQYSFAISDLNLYLDTHPNDKEALDLLTIFIKEENNAKKDYISKYGPLEITNEEDDNTYNWIDSQWPWDDLGGSMYV